MSCLHRLGAAICLLFLLGMAGCGGSDTANSGRQLQQMRKSGAVAPQLYEPVVQQLYIAYFGRPADANGLSNFKYQLTALGYGADVRMVNAGYADNPGMRTLVDSFANSQESQALYTGDTAAFVQAIYVNLLNRAPPENDEGKAFWVNAINSGGLSRAKAAVSILAAALDNKTPQGLLDAQVIANKTDNSSVFTSLVPLDIYRGDSAAAAARSMLSFVTASTTVSGFRATIDSTIDQLTRQSGTSVFAGDYTGSYDGSDQGDFTFTVAADGTITGSGKSTTSGVTLIITGTLGSYNGYVVPLAGTIGPLGFSATLTSAGALSGTWNGLGMSGSLRATRTSH